jgi:L-asparaginase II
MWIEVTRGGRVESRHRIDVAVCDSSGAIVDSYGDALRPTAPRSASKPIQALPLVLTGAADAFSLAPHELALACASHNAEANHVESVRSVLARAGSGVAELECGAHSPMDGAAYEAMIRADVPPGPEHNNCSGKHMGMLITAHHMGEDPTGYIRQEHPVQQRVTSHMAEMCGTDLSKQSPGIDGCGIPVWTVPLAELATGWARMADGGSTSQATAEAANRLFDAMVAEPHFVAGTGRSCTRLMTAYGPRVAVKGGAEGVYCATDREVALGIALKTDDGSRRGSELAIETIIAKLLGHEAPPATPVLNVAGTQVGEVRVATSA